MFDLFTSRKDFNVDPRIFMRPDSEFIRESVCACAKLIVDEEALTDSNARAFMAVSVS